MASYVGCAYIYPNCPTLIDSSGLTVLLFSVISSAIFFVAFSIVFYLAGNVRVGQKKSRFIDAFAFSVLGTPFLNVCLSIFGPEIAVVLSLIVWLLLVRYCYEKGLSEFIVGGVTSVIGAVAILVGLSILFLDIQILSVGYRFLVIV